MTDFPLADFFEFDIRPFTTTVTFESGEHLLEEGSMPEYLYYLVEGRAKLFLSHENGRISLINFLHAPCFIGEMELLGAQDAANGITAVTRCTCYAIDISACKEQLLNDIMRLKQEIRTIKTNMEVVRGQGEKEVTNLDISRRLSQLEKLVYGKDEN